MVDISMLRDPDSEKTTVLVEMDRDEYANSLYSDTNVMDFLLAICGVSPRKPVPYWYPSVGQIWHWEPMLSHATQRIKVVETKMNEDGEFWIGTVAADRLGWHTEVSWNPIGRWMEAAILVDPGE